MNQQNIKKEYTEWYYLDNERYFSLLWKRWDLKYFVAKMSYLSIIYGYICGITVEANQINLQIWNRF